jgi:hypothetical protein
MEQDHHRSKARECVALAGRAPTPQEQLALLDIAQAFLRLAAFTAERNALSVAKATAIDNP